MNKNIALVVVNLPLDKHFDYIVPKALQSKIEVGMRVKINFARRKTIGYVIGFQGKSKFKRLSPILGVVDECPVFDEMALELGRRIKAYCGCSLGEALETTLSPHLKKGRKAEVFKAVRIKHKIPKHTLYYGYTESDEKWNVINKYFERYLSKNQSVLVLVPEKGMVDAVARKVASAYQKQIITHKSGLKVKEQDERAASLNGGKPVIYIGMRASVFTQVHRLGLIITFNEENPAFKEEQSPHYHAREVALMRADIESVDTMWIGHVPSIELWYFAQEMKWKIQYIDRKDKSTVKVIDMMNYNPEKRLSLSVPAQNAIRTAYGAKQQVVIIINQRDFVPFKEEDGSVKRSKAERIKYLVGCIDPNIKVSLFNKEHKADKRAAVIIAVPTVVKETWFKPELTIVANCDTLINAFDFRSSHRAFQFIQELALHSSSVIVQSFMADYYVVKALRAKSADGYYQEELKHRFELGYPPFNHIIAYSARGNDEEKLLAYMNDVYQALFRKKSDQLEIIEPFADMSHRLKEEYRYTIMFKTKEVRPTVDFIKTQIKSIKKPSRTITTIDVDP